MNLVKRNAHSANLFPSLIEEFFRPDWMGGMQSVNQSVPPVNIRESDHSFTVELSSPGKNKEDFNIEVDNDLLTISSEVKSENTSEVGKYTRREFAFSSFKRSFTLPDSVNADEIKANYESGILSIVLPKKEEALPKPKRLIDVL